MVQIILVSSHANVTLLEKVALMLRGNHYPQADVKLSLINEKWSFYVLLQDEDIRFDICSVRHDRLCLAWLLDCLRSSSRRGYIPRCTVIDSRYVSGSSSVQIIGLGKVLELF